MGVVNGDYDPLSLYTSTFILSLCDFKTLSTLSIVHMFLQVDSLSSYVLWSVH